MRVVVVGAGVVGAAIAGELARRGAAVTVVDPLPPGGGTSGASFAWVNASGSVGRADYELHVDGMAAHRELVAAHPGAGWLHPRGHLIAAGSEAGHAHLVGVVERCAELGYAATWRTAVDVLADDEPGLALPGLRQPVAWFPDEAWLDAPAFVSGCLAAAVEHGAVVRAGSRVEAVERRGDGAVTGARLAGGERVEADAVVNAAGASADRVAAMVGGPLVLRAAPGLVLRVQADPPPVRRVVHLAALGVRPDGPDRVLVHAPAVDEHLRPGDDVSLDDPRVRELFRLACEAVPALAAGRPWQARIGHRPMPADDLPSIGAVDGVGGYYEAVMHGAITLAPVVARIAAGEILGGAGDPRLAAFRPGRFAASSGPPPPGAEGIEGGAFRTHG